MRLFPYQEKCIHDLRESYKQGIRRPVLQLPTGGGKTVIAHKILSSAAKKGKKALFLCDRIALCEQAAKEFYKLGSRVAILQQGLRGDSSPDILVASVQSIANRERLPDIDVVLRDEGHVMREYDKKMMTKYNNILFCSLSATPWAVGMGAEGYYQKIIKGPSVEELINLERLTDSDVWAPSKPDLRKVRKLAGEYNQQDLAKITAKRVGDVVEQWFEHGQWHQTMISAVNCKDSIAIIEKLKSKGIKAYHVDYRTSINTMYKKGGVIDQFKAGEIQVLSSVFKLSIGIDLPNCTCLVMAAPYKSLIRHYQFWGRGIRAYPGKESCTVIDMSGNVEDLGWNTDPTPDTLDTGEKPPASSKEYEKREPARCKARLPNGQICGTEKLGQRKCPKCGFEPTPISGVEFINGKLEQIGKKANCQSTPEQKRAFFGGLKHYAQSKGYSEGWAAHKYRSKYGCWPNHYKDAPMIPPNADVLGFITHLNIKYAKGKQKAG